MLLTPRAILHQIITFTVCGAIASVTTAQKVLSLPAPTGLHAIGQASFHFVDQARPEKMTADTEDFRELNVTVWYPAAPESTALATVPYLEHAEIWAS
ncbi:MAG: acetylhydrolase, partial [Planctomycetes bacterium]|nr:acetylhydrolase [Planctomycetota bacterium]